MSKQVKETSTNFTKELKKSFYLCIIKSVLESNKLPKIAISKQSMSYYVNRLKKAGFIKKVGYGIWEANKKKCLETLEFMEGKKSKKGFKLPPKLVLNKVFYFSRKKYKGLRAHKLIFNVKIIPTKNWANREKILKKLGICFYGVGRYKNIPALELKDCKIWLCKRSLRIHFKEGSDLWVSSGREAKRLSENRLREILDNLQKKLKMSFKIGGKYVFDQRDGHLSHVNNPLAKHYAKRKETLDLTYKGKKWAKIENSYDLNEFETIGGKLAFENMDSSVLPFFCSIREFQEKFNKVPDFIELYAFMAKIAETTSKMMEAIKNNSDGVKVVNQKLLSWDGWDKEKKIPPHYVG